MALPKILKNFHVEMVGKSYLGMATEVELPKVVTKKEERYFSGHAGMSEIDYGLVEKLECKITMSEIDHEVWNMFGLNGAFGLLRIRGAIQKEGESAKAVIAQMRGTISEIDYGQWKVGEDSPVSIMLTCRTYLLTIDSVEVLQIDIENGLFAIKGVDQTGSIRSALGL